MTPPEPPCEFPRPVATEALPPEGLAFRIEAVPQERERVAIRLELARLDTLVAEGRLVREPAADLVHVSGTVRATLAQLCVVTLEPVPAEVTVPIDRRFGTTAEDMPPGEELVLDPFGPDVEPLHGGSIDLGELAVEELALGLDPYPRHPEADAVLAALRPDEPEEGPFARLAQPGRDGGPDQKRPPTQRARR